MFNEKRLLVSILVKNIIDTEISQDGNSMSYSYDTIRSIAEEHLLDGFDLSDIGIFKILKDAENDYFIMDVDEKAYGCDGNFFDENDEELYEENVDVKGVMISLGDSDFYDTYEDFYDTNASYYFSNGIEEQLIDSYYEFESLRLFRFLPDDVDYLKLILNDNKESSIQFLIYLKIVEIINKTKKQDELRKAS